jgi:hypothetical protein
MRRGNDGPHRPENREGAKQPCRSVVGRLLDAFDKDGSGVPAWQHSATPSYSATALRFGLSSTRIDCP